MVCDVVRHKSDPEGLRVSQKWSVCGIERIGISLQHFLHYEAIESPPNMVAAVD